MDSNPPPEGTWDYDHMDVTVDADELESKDEISPINKTVKRDDSVLSKQSSEDREVEKFTGKSKELGKITSENTSESEESVNKEDAPSNRFRSLSDHKKLAEDRTDEEVLKPTIIPPPTKPCFPSTKTEIIEYKNDSDSTVDEVPLPATFIKKPAKPKSKSLNLWKMAGLSIKAKVSSNKGLLGVVKQAENQGKIKTKIFNKNVKNLTKAIADMAQKQAETEKVKINSSELDLKSDQLAEHDQSLNPDNQNEGCDQLPVAAIQDEKIKDTVRAEVVAIPKSVESEPTKDHCTDKKEDTNSVPSENEKKVMELPAIEPKKSVEKSTKKNVTRPRSSSVTSVKNKKPNTETNRRNSVAGNIHIEPFYCFMKTWLLKVLEITLFQL